MARFSVIEILKEDLKILLGQPAQISADFCKLAWSFLSRGANMKLYQAVSQKLQVDMKQIQSGIEGLANVFIETQKNALNENELREILMNFGFSKESAAVIWNEYLSQKQILEQSLSQAGILHLQFRSLEWRFETEVASRSLRSQVQPRIIMKLDFIKGGKTESVCLQSDIPNMVHMNNVVCQALQNSNSVHARRIQRAVS